jgi:hypothetical protein
MPTFTDEITHLSKGLLFPSETDAPIRPWVWRRPDRFSLEALRAAQGYSQDTPIVTLDLDEFFASATRDYDWHGPEEQERARRFRAVVAALKARLRDIRVYKVGESGTLDVFAVGRADDGTTAGVTTQVVET